MSTISTMEYQIISTQDWRVNQLLGSVNEHTSLFNDGKNKSPGARDVTLTLLVFYLKTCVCIRPLHMDMFK